VRPQRAEAEVAPGGPLCGQCGTANPPGRRFCRHCGAAVAAGGGPGVPEPMPSPGPAPWWRRVRRRSAGAGRGEGATPSRAARVAYRRTLDVRYRVMRALALVAGVGLLAGSLGLAGVNPIAGARGLWDRAFSRDRQVGELSAAADPAEVVQADFQPGFAVDGDSDTAWATPWIAEEGAPPAEACAAPAASGTDGGAPGTGGAQSALVVTLPEAAEVSKIEVQPGLAAGDPARATQRQPTLLELRFDDGSCTTVELADEAGFQEHRLDGPETATVRIAVLDSAQATDEAASQGLVAIGEVRIFTPR
jgi:hypothetical protein